MRKNTITALLSGILLVLTTGTIQAEETFTSWLLSLKRHKEVAQVTDKVYLEECGSCHFAYPPGLLPEASWRKLLDKKALEDHFGDNAELEEATRTHVLDLLVANSAEKTWYKRSRKVMNSLSEGEAPLRITKVPYIKEKHEDVREDEKAVKNNKKVKSMSFCDKCHQKAEEGRFDDDTVVIPDYGTWTW